MEFNKMEFREINVSEDIIQQIDPEKSLADVTVDMGNGDNIYSNFNIEVLYEDTIEYIENTLETVPVFMRFLPKKVLIHNWSSWKKVEEMNLERARYLLNTDELLEEMLNGS
jgi:hypothetical protein